MTPTVKILDCTLRDGGYVNDWSFGESNIRLIVDKLVESGIELIECGFIADNKPFDSSKTLFPNIETANSILPNTSSTQFACMINYGACDVNAFPEYSGKGICTIRIAFHRKDLKLALEDCRTMIRKGYRVFIQPMATSSYSDEELCCLLDESNGMKPAAVYVVDSFGTMQDSDVIKLFDFYEKHLDSSIAVGFHSHNNLQLSFPNAMEILRRQTSRELIIDSSVYGMGRGAGNLCTELIIRHLNQTYARNYQIVPILEIIDSCLNAIFIRTPWGYSVPYYVASVNGCHPNYATYLVNKQTLGVRQINTILSRIPESEKRFFNTELISKLYYEYQSFAIDDSESITSIRNLLAQRNILLLAPGKSLLTYRKVVDKFVESKHPIIISINFLPEFWKQDVLFLSNMKRFSNVPVISGNVIATSNIEISNGAFVVDYSSLTEPNQAEPDNAGLMLLRLLVRVGIGQVTIAGFDGFSEDIHENYVDERMINNTVTEIFAERNANVKAQLEALKNKIQINFLTPTRYE